jgi:hypothetical protein
LKKPENYITEALTTIVNAATTGAGDLCRAEGEQSSKTLADTAAMHEHQRAIAGH